MKKPNHRVFDYTPRFYVPETDENERKKRKLGFSKQIHHKRKKTNPAIWILFILAVIYAIIQLGGL